jgi:hypothetical protein
MREVVLPISGEGATRRALVIGIWTAVCALIVVSTYQASRLADARSALTLVPEVSRAKSSANGAGKMNPSQAELELAGVVEAHALARFAGWNDAFANLAAALPTGVVIERLTLNAKSGRGDATVRVARVEEVSRTVEALEATPNFSAATARRCEQTRARDQTGMRCELGFAWTRRVE